MAIFTSVLPRGSASIDTAVNVMGPHYGTKVAATTTKQAVDLSAHIGQFCSVKNSAGSSDPVYVVLLDDVASTTNESAEGVAVVAGFPTELAPGESLSSSFVVSPSSRFHKLVIWTASGTASVRVEFS